MNNNMNNILLVYNCIIFCIAEEDCHQHNFIKERKLALYYCGIFLNYYPPNHYIVFVQSKTGNAEIPSKRCHCKTFYLETPSESTQKTPPDIDPMLL